MDSNSPNMPNYYYLLCFLALFNPNADTSNVDQVRQIEIRKVPFQRMYPINISCADFEMRAASIFPDTFYITQPAMQQRIINGLANAKKAYQYDLDIRAKILITYNSGKIDTLCLSEFEFFNLNGTVMAFPNADVVNMVDSLPSVNYNHHFYHK